MPKQAAQFDEKNLTKGHLRKLTALRKSLGQEIADKAFSEWLSKQNSEPGGTEDKTARLIAEALEKLIKDKKLTFSRGGYLVRRGRGRVIVEKAESDKAD